MKPNDELHDPTRPDQGHADPHNIPHDDGSTGHHPNQEFIDFTETPERLDVLLKSKENVTSDLGSQDFPELLE